MGSQQAYQPRKKLARGVTNKDNNIKSITVNGRFFSQPITGVQRYAHELLRSLDSLLAAGQLEPVPTTVIVPPDTDTLPYYSFLGIRRVGHLRGQMWEQFELPHFAKGSLLFTPCGGAPIVHRPHVLTIHDAGPFSTPNAYKALYRNYYKALQRHLVRSASHVITVSNFSKRELMKALRIPDDKISVTYLSGEHILRYEADESILMQHSLRKGNYILGVSSKNPNKNLSGLVHAAASFPPGTVQFAIAGGSNTEIFGKSLLTADTVKELGFVNDSQLRSLYENAACFVFPSFYEGFGLPPLEALTVGCPIVIANTASLPEIFGEAATYCNPYSAEDIALHVSRVLRHEYPSREVAQAHVSQFAWDLCAKQTWEILLKQSAFNASLGWRAVYR